MPPDNPGGLNDTTYVDILAFMITATRAYERGSAHLNAQVIIGPAAQGALAATNANMNLETGDGHIRTSPIDGLQVTRTFTNSNKSGAILVALGPSALFTISFDGVAEDEALNSGEGVQLESHPGRNSEIVLIVQ